MKVIFAEDSATFRMITTTPHQLRLLRRLFEHYANKIGEVLKAMLGAFGNSFDDFC